MLLDSLDVAGLFLIIAFAYLRSRIFSSKVGWGLDSAGLLGYECCLSGSWIVDGIILRS